jgi:hypothetical protein
MESLKTAWNYRYGKKEGIAATHYDDGVLKWKQTSRMANW